MTPERWGRIKEVFQGALELDEDRRGAFVNEACGPDADLRREVLRLLREHPKVATQEVRRNLTGQTISHYTITEKLGEGGMGVVYKAEDVRLRRTVALKLLRADAVGNEELKARFLQEARAAAALDHSNICTVHDIDETEGYTFLVMAYVPGETLSDKIRQRPLDLEEALDIAAQMAEGLRAAHETGIVHRDIKSANIIVSDKGQVKITDFGLAYLTCETRITKTGTIMGTPAYMSPEQVRGEEVDYRTDIWSLGVVLYEMVTGQLPFHGDSSQTVALAIQNEEAEPITALRAGLPIELEFVMGKALAKDRTERYQHIEELIVDLKSLSRKVASGRSHILRPPSAASARGKRSKELAPKRRPGLPWVVAAVAGVALLGIAWVDFRQPPPGPAALPLRRFAFSPPVTVRAEWFNRNVAISPNGKHVAMAAAGPEGKLWIQDLDRWQPRSVEGTEGAHVPFWSPDSGQVAYVAGNELMRVRVDGGTPTRVCPLPKSPVAGGTWSPDGELIVFAAHELFAVPATGGVAQPLRLPDASIQRKYHPSFLPSDDGARILVFAGGSGALNLYVHDLRTDRLELLGAGCKPSYSASGHLVYQPTEFTHELWALPFSLEKLKATGNAFVVARNALEATVAADATLVHREPRSAVRGRFTWLDRKGREVETIDLGQVSNLYRPRLSPAGDLVAYVGRAGSGVELDIWLYDLVRGRNLRVTTDPGRDLGPTWSPSGEYLAFTSNAGGTFNIYVRRSDGSGEVKSLTDTGNNVACDWSRDGKYLLYEETASDPFGDLWYLERNPDGSMWEPKPYLQTPHGERFAFLSPDGRFVAYLSNETGREELNVRPFPEGTGRWTISTGGAFHLRWRSDGRELFYVSQGALMAVPVSTEPSFSMKTPTRLFALSSPYDVSADGQRFLVVPAEEDSMEPVIRVVQNWHAEFRNGQ